MTLSDHHHDYKNNRFLHIVSHNETHHDFVEPVTYFMFHGRQYVAMKQYLIDKTG